MSETQPISSIFQGYVVCTTGLHADVKHKVSLMVAELSGMFQDDLTNDVTHLIANTVASEKFRVAIKWNLEVVTFDWVADCWKYQKLQQVSLYRLALFTGLVVCTTGLTQDRADQIEDLVKKNGGQYNADLEVETTTHLIAEKPVGPKYDAAVEWQITIVNPQWIFDSVKEEVCMNIDKYPVEDFSLESIDKHLSSMNSQNTYGWYFSCCCIFLGSFNSKEVCRLASLIRLGMGTRSVEMIDSVTHIVLPDNTLKSELNRLLKISPSAYIVSPKWILKCCLESKLVSIERFPVVLGTMKQYYDTQQELLLQQETQLYIVPQEEEIKKLSIQEQLSAQGTRENTNREGYQSLENEQEENSTKIFFNYKFAFMSNEDPIFKESIERVGGELLECDPEMAIKIASNTLQASITHIIVPYVTVLDEISENRIKSRYRSAQFVTQLWLDCCLEQNRCLSIHSHPFFRRNAFSLRELPSKETANYSVSISVYSGVERTIIHQFLNVLKINYSKRMNKKNTHLICCYATGLKYTKALEWGLRIVSAEWLYSCAKEMKLLIGKEYEYPVYNLNTKKIEKKRKIDDYQQDMLQISYSSRSENPFELNPSFCLLNMKSTEKEKPLTEVNNCFFNDTQVSNVASQIISYNYQVQSIGNDLLFGQKQNHFVE